MSEDASVLWSSVRKQLNDRNAEGVLAILTAGGNGLFDKSGGAMMHQGG